MKFHHPIYKRITFALFMNLKNHHSIFYSLLDFDNSKKYNYNHKIDQKKGNKYNFINKINVKESSYR